MDEVQEFINIDLFTKIKLNEIIEMIGMSVGDGYKKSPFLRDAAG